MRATLVVCVLVASLGTVHANGRDPAASTINFQRGNDQHIVAGMTFGLVRSVDGGATWQWMCERAVGYGGQYDPDYVYTASGAVFATTFDGLKVMRDGCSFVSTPPGMTFVSKAEQGPDGTIYYAAADLNDAKVYRSTDDGVTFPTSASPGVAGDWWASLAVAPSNAQRVYATGYRLDGVNPKIFLLKTSTNGGTSFTDMALTSTIQTSANSVLEVVGISPTSDQTLYLRATFQNGALGDTIYRSTDAGQTWTAILTKSSNYGLAFLARADGTCVAGTRDMGAWVSTNCATAATPTWTPLASPPHITCLYQDSTGVVWACTQNYASPQLGLPSDGYGIMKSSDLATWTGVLRFQDIQAPVACAAGTVQHDQCVQKYMDQQSQWCCLVPQLGITSTEIDCTGPLACFGSGATDAGVDAGVDPGVDAAVDGGTGGPGIKPKPSSCCGVGHGRSSALLALVVLMCLRRRRRR